MSFLEMREPLGSIGCDVQRLASIGSRRRALGMKTSFKQVFAAGWRPVGLTIAETAWIAVLVFISVRFLI
jgi:uncharacterized membrane protein YadS